MQEIVDLFSKYGPWLVFASVFIEQLGLPVPAIPTIIVAGALAMEGLVSWPMAFAAAIVGSGIANFIWYLAGRRFGLRTLALICRVSMSPDTCIARTSSAFTRWGVIFLPAARFVPGFRLVAAPLAGATGVGAIRFILFDTLGTVLWSGSALGLGAILHRQIALVIDALNGIGLTALAAFVLIFLLYLLGRWFKRQRLIDFAYKYHVSVADLRRLMMDDPPPVVVDVRGSEARQADPRAIPGAVTVDIARLVTHFAALPKDREIVLYCACPNDASSAHAAQLLRGEGFFNARPLKGGLDAWLAER